MKNKVLFTITDLSIIDDLKGLGINKFVYPLSFFCVGIPRTFQIEEITEDNAYLYINRVLDCQAIDKLSVILNSLPNNIKGIIFEDVGLIELLKDNPIEKILFYSHFNTNYESINYYLDYVDNVIISPDITEEEIDEIILKAKKPISLYVFGLISSLYSRRTLLSNYAMEFNLDKKEKRALEVNNKKFIAIENEFGTVIYHYPYYNGKRLLKKDVKYHFYFPILIDKSKIINIAKGNFDEIETDEGFLDTKTIYRVKNTD